MREEASVRVGLWGMGAGLIYFAAVFAIGFVLGTVRTLIVAPALGELAAVAIELPFMLAVAWAVCGWTIRRCNLPQQLSVRSAMGLTAFCCLMLLISIVLSDRSLIEHIGLYRESAAQLGLAGQVLFGLFPVFLNDK